MPLILDDWGLEPLDASFLSTAGTKSSAIPTYADAILDRLVHNAHRIELEGESMRRTRAKQSRKD